MNIMATQKVTINTLSADIAMSSNILHQQRMPPSALKAKFLKRNARYREIILLRHITASVVVIY